MTTPSESRCPVCLGPLSDQGQCARCARTSVASGRNDAAADTVTIAKNRSTVDDREVRQGARTDLEASDRLAGGRYKLMERIGEGGFGVVWMAEQKEPVRRRVAVKILKLGMDTQQVVARFEAERQALAMMEHPNIAKVLDAGATETGRPFFVMELVRGIPITHYCDEERLDTPARLVLFQKVCHAIQHAHQKGIIHRDIKPSNILISLEGNQPEPKVIDFGIAKATQGNLTDKTLYTAFEQFMGTPAYMSPEQAEMGALDIDTRSDIYSLGVLLYELLAGQPPFDPDQLAKAGMHEIRRTIRDIEPVRPSTRLNALTEKERTTTARRRRTESRQLLHQVKGDLDWIVMKCLEKQRSRRYESASSLAADLQRHLEDETVTARPPSTLYRVQKAFHRHRTAWVATFVIALALVGGGTFALWQAAEARSDRNRAIQAQHEAELDRRSAIEHREKAETSAKSEAREARRREEVERANLRLEMQNAEAYFDSDNPGKAMAVLTRLLRRNPALTPALDRLVNQVLHMGWPALEMDLSEAATALCVEFSPDGQKVVTASEDGSARLWDASTGSLLLTTPSRGLRMQIARFDPSGRRIVTGCDDGVAEIWDCDTGSRIGIAMAHTNRVFRMIRDVRFSPDGQRVFTASQDARARVWDARTGRPLTEWLEHEGPVRAGGISPDGQYLVTACLEGYATVWSVSSGKNLSGKLAHPAGWATASAEFSPEGRFIVTADQGGMARLWADHLWKEEASPKRSVGYQGPVFSHKQPVLSARFSPDGSKLVSYSEDGVAKIWDVARGVQIGESLVQRGFINYAEFSRDGKRVVTASGIGTVCVWDSATGKSVAVPIRTGDNSYQARFSPDGQRLVIAVAQAPPQIWRLNPGTPGCVVLRDLEPITAAVMTPDARTVITSGRRGRVVSWDTESGKIITTVSHTIDSNSKATVTDITAEGTLAAVAYNYEGVYLHAVPSLKLLGHLATGDRGTGVTFSKDGHSLLSWTHRDSRLWDVRTYESLGRGITNNTPIVCARLSADGKYAVAASYDNRAQIWSPQGNGLPLVLEGHEHRVNWAEFSPDGLRVTTASGDTTASIWDARSGVRLGTLEHYTGVTETHFDASGKVLATASDDGAARLWDVESGRLLFSPIDLSRFIASMKFSPDGRRLAIAFGHFARVWDVRSGFVITPYLTHEDDVNTLQFSADSSRLLTASDDRAARLWEIPDLKGGQAEHWAQLAEALGGFHLTDEGVFQPLDADSLDQLRSDAAQWPENDPVRVYAESKNWFLSPAGR